MSETTENTINVNDEPEVVSQEERDKQEYALLKERARAMGLTVSNNIGLETLRSKVNEAMGAVPDENADKEQVNALEPNVKKRTLRQKLYDEEMRLIRVRITCMNPNKKELPGEVFTFANEYLGTVRKYVPFGEATENGYHVPHCIFTMMQARKFLNIRTYRDRRTGTDRVESNWAKEFAIEVLDPLTQKDLDKLATAQIASGSLE